MNPAIGIALAYQVSDHGSIGFQFLAGYSQKDVLTERDLLNAGILSEKLKIDQTTRTIKFTAGFGYIYNTPETQVGVLIRPGTGSFEQELLDLQYKDLLDSDLGGLGPGPYVNDSSDRTRLTPFQGAYTDGINIAVGGYTRLSPMFAFAFESAYTMANSYTGQDFSITDENDQDVYEVVNNSNVVNIKDTLTLRGGVDVTLSPALSVLAGLGYGFFESTSSTMSDESSFKSRSEYSLLYATLGCAYTLSASSSISILANAAKITSEANLNQDSFSVSVDQDLILMDIAIGVSLAF
jgi:long-subunit fatty acid transport protein